MLSDALVKVDEIVQSSSTQFSKVNEPWTTDDITSLNSNIDGIYNKYKSVTLLSPNPSTSTQITPIYITVSFIQILIN